MLQIHLYFSLGHIISRRESKNILDKEMKRLCYLGVLKEGFFSILESN